jgi:hypothetical protein
MACTRYSFPESTAIDPSELDCRRSIDGRYRFARLSRHTSKISGEVTNALSDITDGKASRAKVLRVSRGANCLHLLQFALVVLSLNMDEASVSANEGASPA